MKKVLVIGAGGMLGHGVTTYFSHKGIETVRTTRKEFDIAKDPIEKLSGFFEGCDFAINCAGVIKPRIATMSIEDVLKVNSIFPRNLAKLAASHGVQTFHVTTDCVYSGKKGRYTESDPFDADDLYGLSKNGGDTIELMTLRTSIIGEEFGQGRSLLAWAQSQAGKPVNGFTNHLWNGITTVYLAEVMDKINKEGRYENGIFHIHSPEAIDKAQLLGLFNDVYGLGLKINPVEAHSACDRSLSTEKPLCARMATKSLPDQIREMREIFAGAAI